MAVQHDYSCSKRALAVLRFLAPNPGCRRSHSNSAPLWSGCFSLMAFEPGGTCWPLGSMALIREPCWWHPGCSVTWLPCIFQRHGQKSFSQCPRKRRVSLGGFQPTVFPTLERAFGCPPPPVMLSFSGRLSNWRADMGLPGTPSSYSHGVHDDYVELPPLACPLESRKVWFQHHESFDISFCRVGKEECFSRDSALKSWERHGCGQVCGNQHL